MASLESSSDASTTRPLPLGSAPDAAPARFMGATTGTWLKVGVIAVAFFWLYRENLWRLWEMTNPYNGDDNWKHGMCIPAIGLYYLFLRRDELAAAPIEPLLGGHFSKARIISASALIGVGLLLAFFGFHLLPQGEGWWIIRGILENSGHGMWAFGILVLLLDWGLAAFLGGLFISGYWPAQNNFVWDFGMVLTLFGAVLTTCGWRVMRIAWFPIVFLVCMLPWPQLVYSQVASPLQAMAARVSVGILQVTGIDASYGGTKIFIPQFGPDGLPTQDRTLNVAEACAGLKSLMSFISIAAAIAFISARPLWQKLIITFSAIPIAISCNVMRVAGQGLLDHYVGREWSEGFAHQFAGMIMMLPAFLLILLVCWIVDHLFIEQALERRGMTPGTAAPGLSASGNRTTGGAA